MLHATHRCIAVVIVLIVVCSSSIAQVDNHLVFPEHYRSLPAASVQNIHIAQKQLLQTTHTEQTPHFYAELKQGVIDIPVTAVHYGMDGTRSFAETVSLGGVDWLLIYTQGHDSGYGELIGQTKRLVIEQRGDQVMVIDVGMAGLAPRLRGNDVLGALPQLSDFARPHTHHENIPQGDQSVLQTQYADSNEVVVVDIMLLFTQNIVDTFPQQMAQTLLQHLVFKANQSFADSGINMRLRLVHTEFVDYQDPSSLTALNQIVDALDGDNNTPTVASLQNIASLRQSSGADIVSMIRTHNLNEREVCGVAMFPDPSTNFLANVSNVGISGGSNCLDTFTHEIGHNFGAGHQRVNNNSQGAQPAAGALIVSGKFNTMMSSIGTGDINRDFGLPVFSNPNIQCGGVSCGDRTVANNVATVNSFAAINAALNSARSELPVPDFLPITIDRDGDGILDSEDAFPFDPQELSDSDLDGVGDNADAFVNDRNEQADTDQDGVGDNADSDDDNDGANDNDDDLPLDPADTVDSDGDGVGASKDQLDNNFQESKDFDGDGIGDIADLDDDNDGVPDYFVPQDLSQTEAWVVSAQTDSLLRFNAQTGEYIDVLLSVPEGGFSFRSDMVLSETQQLYFVAFSDVLSFDRQSATLRRVIDRSELNSNFPGHVLLRNDSIWVSHGFGPSNIQSFNLTETGNFGVGSIRDVAVWRDMGLLNNRLIVASRSENTLLSLNPNSLASTPQVFASQGLNGPEHIVIDAKQNIYVTNAITKDISRFDSNGTFIERFINAGSGGLGLPSCITIGPDLHIYVCSSDTGQVLKYDGETGAFLSVFIEAGAGDLGQPVSIVFAGLPHDELRLDGAHDTDGDTINNDQDDLPLDPTESVDTDGDGVGNNADLDDDNDSMPDEYEVANNLDPLNPADATQDADGDGSSNLAEFVAGTDPNDIASTPAAPVPQPLPETPEASSGGGLSIGCLIVCLCLLVGRRYSSRKFV